MAARRRREWECFRARSLGRSITACVILLLTLPFSSLSLCSCRPWPIPIDYLQGQERPHRIHAFRPLAPRFVLVSPLLFPFPLLRRLTPPSLLFLPSAIAIAYAAEKKKACPGPMGQFRGCNDLYVAITVIAFVAFFFAALTALFTYLLAKKHAKLPWTNRENGMNVPVGLLCPVDNRNEAAKAEFKH